MQSLVVWYNRHLPKIPPLVAKGVFLLNVRESTCLCCSTCGYVKQEVPKKLNYAREGSNQAGVLAGNALTEW